MFNTAINNIDFDIDKTDEKIYLIIKSSEPKIAKIIFKGFQDISELEMDNNDIQPEQQQFNDSQIQSNESFDENEMINTELNKYKYEMSHSPSCYKKYFTFYNCTLTVIIILCISYLIYKLITNSCKNQNLQQKQQNTNIQNFSQHQPNNAIRPNYIRNTNFIKNEMKTNPVEISSSNNEITLDLNFNDFSST